MSFFHTRFLQPKADDMNKLLLLTSFLLLNAGAYAQWSTDPSSNTPVATGGNYQSFKKSISDGAGGTFIIWGETSYDINLKPSYKILVQRFSSAGIAQWGNAVSVASSTKQAEDPEIISDNNGGVIISWAQFDLASDNDRIESSYDVYAQKINTAGEKQWGENGLAVAAEAGYQSILEIANFGDGRCRYWLL